jgi:tetratricopeptide (TPR) repeat protein
MKALEKDRNRRYETATGLGADVRRYLDDEPVQACPPSAWYRLSKTARRHRAALVTAAVVASALVLGTAVSTWQAVRARKAERNAAVARSLAEVRRADSDAQRRLAEEGSRQARQAVDEMYTQVAEKWLAGQPRLEKVQREFLEKALTFYQDFARERGAEPAVRLEVAKAYGRVGEIRRTLGQNLESEEAYRHAVDTLEVLVKEAPGQPEYRRDIVFGYTRLGSHLNNMGQVLDSERALRRAVAFGETLVTDFPADNKAQFRLAGAHLILGILLYELHRTDEADRTLRRAIELQESLATHSADLPGFQGQLALNQA